MVKIPFLSYYGGKEGIELIPVVLEIQDKGVDWDLLMNGAGLAIAFLAIFGGIITYNYQKKREYYERSLLEVYSPLYMLICKQEVIRRLYLSDVSIEEAPILTMEKKKVKQKFDLPLNKMVVEESTETGILNRKDFLKILNNTNKGLASPELLRLISEYEIVVYLEENLKKNSDEWEKATNEKVEIELSLFKEIIRGYTKYKRKLRVGNTKDPKQYK